MKRTRMVVKHSNLTDKHWRKIANWLPKPHAKGRRRSICRRSVVNAILYINRTGCGWRYLPCDVPNWNPVYGLFRQWAASGVWQRINDHLREQVRLDAGRKRSPTAAIIDSQSPKTAEADGPRGYDGGKKVTGRKRQLVVDTLGPERRSVGSDSLVGACQISARGLGGCGLPGDGSMGEGAVRLMCGTGAASPFRQK